MCVGGREGGTLAYIILVITAGGARVFLPAVLKGLVI